jgi:hypothetical protein
MVCEGTYNPANPIEVTKDLTIEGRAAANRDDIEIQTAASTDGFEVMIDGVTLRRMNLVGTGAGGDNGVHVQAGQNDNALEDLEVTGFEDCIFLDDSEGNVIQGNETHDCGDAGIQASNGVDNVIGNNTSADNNNSGVFLVAEDGALVEGNTLTGNDVQIWLNGKVNARVLRNTITTIANSDGILMDAMPAESLVIIGDSAEDANTFSGPFDPAAGDYYVELVCGSENTVNATNNWWGSVNRTDIANRIFNDEDDLSVECAAPDDVKGAVVFHPWATGPAPTPSPTATPTATGTPTATATGTPTPTATPGATRTIDLSPQGWHDLAWSGADATDPGTALACISGKYSIAYAWEGPTAGFKRHVEGCAIPGICNMAALNKYDTLLVNISAAGVSCAMPVAP